MSSFLRDPRRLARAVGLILVLAVWTVLLLFAVGGVFVYRIYADLTAPQTSRATAGGPSEVVARAIYLWRYREIWQARDDCNDFDPVLAYVPKPGAVHFTGAEFDTLIHVTPQRVRAQPAARPGAPLVVVTGDSYAFGWGAQDDETFCSLLQRDYGYHTVNTAVPSYGTARELLRVRQLGLTQHIDALFIQFCDNDWRENQDFIRDPSSNGSPGGARQVFDEFHAYQPSPMTYWNVFADTARWLRVQLAARTPVRTLLTQRPAPFGAPTSYRGGITGAQMAADFLAVLDHFPELKDTPVFVAEFVPNNGYTGFTDTLKKLVRNRPHVIPVQIHYVSEDFYRFDEHLTPPGHRTAAAQIAAALKQVLPPDRTSDAAAQHPGF